MQGDKEFEVMKKVSVITVNRNNAASLEKTIQSVIAQTFADFEYIIIDGNSADGSVDVIRKYADHVSFWCSEPDTGPYDAMNKGVEHAAGEWCIFMNSGDRFADEHVLSNVFSAADASACDVIYGDVISTFSWGELKKVPEPIDGIETHMVFCHQSSLVRTALAKELKFDTGYKIAADFNLFRTLYKHGGRFRYVPVVIAVYNAEDGISSRLVRKREYEYGVIAGLEHNAAWKCRFEIRMFAYSLKNMLKAKTPKSVLGVYRYWKILRNGKAWAKQRRK